jgi:RND superfamily putative drug exporter
MDYEVFILSRIRGKTIGPTPPHTPSSPASTHTGGVVTSAALILFLAFIALGSSVPEVAIQVLATGLAVGIALDATIVRALLVPALIGILGSANWWTPWRTTQGKRAHPEATAESA